MYDTSRKQTNVANRCEHGPHMIICDLYIIMCGPYVIICGTYAIIHGPCMMSTCVVAPMGLVMCIKNGDWIFIRVSALHSTHIVYFEK